ncbi:voltage-dependent calcium channel subunit alpha-2/delta-1-like, partial [Anneissia japonica]|uniref:voltage-dependent calcium channel subunit alpha-2/delta-1-like n=1 Tax=Anneissia japonica TaxID=1529436 RepID=UPI001425941A
MFIDVENAVLKMASYWAVIYLFIFCVVGSCSSESVIPPLDQVQEWARDIQTKLFDYLTDNMKPDKLSEIYEDSVKNNELKEVYVDGNELVAKVATNWVSLLEKKKTAVKKIVEFLENSSLTTPYSANPEVDFLNAKGPTKELQSVLTDTFGGKNVTYNQSAVQIPTDIYVKDPIILNAIKVTDGIDEVFMDNMMNDTELLWQYVGSSTGFYRSYPGKDWDLPEGKLTMDQYDVRRRSWYIGAANSPKDVLILVDISGSTSGITSNLIKVSVCEAIDTLGDDDFVNVALFNDNTTFLDSKLTTFVQANLRNKQHLKKEIKEYMDQKKATEKMANYTRALEFAFTELKKLMDAAEQSDLGIGAQCNSVILMFTDGGPDKAKEIINKYNSDNRTRIFVYNVGPNAMVSSDGVKSMACMTNGYFSNIPSIGAVRLTTLDYIPVLSRPLVLAGNRTYQWSNIYLDALGLGMMTTLTLPAFNKSKTYDANGNEIPNQQLLGVVGTDVTIKGMEDLVPKRRPHYNSSYRCIGPEGYAFGINSNGYILIHPRLKGQEEIEPILKLGYLSDPPNVDLLEVEVIPKGSVDLANLRRAMIDEKTSNVTFPSLIMSQGERYVHYINMTYSFTNINATSFSMAIVQPKFDLYEFQVDKDNEIFSKLINFFAEECNYTTCNNEGICPSTNDTEVTQEDEEEELVPSDNDMSSFQVEIENEEYDSFTDDISSLQIKIEQGIEGNVDSTDDLSSLVLTQDDEEEELVPSDNDMSSLQIKIERGIEGNVDLTDDLSSLVPYITLAKKGERMGTALFPNWELCEGLTSSSTIKDVLEQLMKEYQVMRSSDVGMTYQFVNCEETIVSCLWFDMWAVHEFETKNGIAALFDKDNGPDYLMIASKCGYTHIYPNWTQELSNSCEDLRDPWEQNYYQRS